jgi:DNA-directed RNA polymerase subunit H
MSSTQQVSILKLYEVFRNSLRMLRYRNCDEARLTSLETYYDLETFTNQIKTSSSSIIIMSIIREYNNNKILTVLAFLAPDKPVKKATFTEILNFTETIRKEEETPEHNLVNIILITPTEQTNFTNIIQAYNYTQPFEEGYASIFNGEMGLCKSPYIELFTYEEFGFDKLSHDYVPKHTLLTREEKETMLTTYSLEENHLPQILTSDVVVRIIGGIEGAVIKIERVGYSTGITIVYRKVVKNVLFEQKKKKKQ